MVLSLLVLATMLRPGIKRTESLVRVMWMSMLRMSEEMIPLGSMRECFLAWEFCCDQGHLGPELAFL